MPTLDTDHLPHSTAGQFRSLDMRPRGFLNKGTLASDLLQGSKLQIEVLVFRGDPRIADVHEAVLSLIYGTTKPLIGHGRETVSKLLLIRSMDASELFRRHKHGVSSNATLCHNKRTTV